MSKVLLIDNYDSFTFNLYHYLEEIVGGEILIMRNDEIEFDKAKEFDSIVISPGPGLPDTAGDLMNLLQQSVDSKKILGICLGQQAIAQYFGMKLKNLDTVVHGQRSKIRVVDQSDSLFVGLPEQFNVGRYHSWVIDPQSIVDEITVTSVSEEGDIMSIAHKSKRIQAVQFHPESVLTDHGKAVLFNWVNS